MKLRNLSGIKTENAPDHILQEIQNLTEEIGKILLPILRKHNPNIVLSALNFFHVSMIKLLISDNRKELERAVILEGEALFENMKILIELMEKENK